MRFDIYPIGQRITLNRDITLGDLIHYGGPDCYSNNGEVCWRTGREFIITDFNYKAVRASSHNAWIKVAFVNDDGTVHRWSSWANSEWFDMDDRARDIITRVGAGKPYVTRIHNYRDIVPFSHVEFNVRYTVSISDETLKPENYIAYVTTGKYNVGFHNYFIDAALKLIDGQWVVSYAEATVPAGETIAQWSFPINGTHTSDNQILEHLKAAADYFWTTGEKHIVESIAYSNLENQVSDQLDVAVAHQRSAEDRFDRVFNATMDYNDGEFQASVFK